MALRNRVTPLGALVADAAREALVFGNRGCLHDDRRQIVRAPSIRRWIACRLEFKGRTRELMQPGRYTELFFLDDATALAAGHRPCAECRRADYAAFIALVDGADGAEAMDRRLHGERVGEAGERRLHAVAPDDLPDGAFVLDDGAPWLVTGDALARWTPSGYAEQRSRPAGGEATTITPTTTLAVLRAGWSPEAVPFLHPTAT